MKESQSLANHSGLAMVCLNGDRSSFGTGATAFPNKGNGTTGVE